MPSKACTSGIPIKPALENEELKLATGSRLKKTNDMIIDTTKATNAIPNVFTKISKRAVLYSTHNDLSTIVGITTYNKMEPSCLDPSLLTNPFLNSHTPINIKMNITMICLNKMIATSITFSSQF
ncbi:hypothetical protein SDC9_130996 [bioreactor metagenome]|uniref:Uncharacterized protein n=1 Tax=bioreactor metagenome TaxID=1076179 RepID=A0A645D3H2_9ZZZZ